METVHLQVGEKGWEDVMKNEVIDKVSFTKSMRLTAKTIRKLKSLYQ